MRPNLGLAPGHVLAQKYQLAECIGRGGMGEVWRAQHLALKADVAIKFIHTALSGAEEMTTRFVREAQAAAAIRSPHVVQILDYGVDGDLAYIVMELMPGESLGARLAREHRVPPDVLARIMTHVGRALGRAHAAGIVHRDLKPDNIFLIQTDDELIAKVLDFGIAKFQPALGGTLESSTRTGSLMGTPFYMSPEQAEGERQVDLRTDIWAMGVISYQALLGKLPFDSDALGGLLLRICSHPIPVPSQVGPVPQGFDQWFATAVNRDPNSRFASAKDAAAALEAVCARAAAQTTLSVATPPALETSSPSSAVVGTNQPLSRTLDPLPKRSVFVPVLALTGIGAAVLVGGGYFALTQYRAGAAPAATALASAESALAPMAPKESTKSDDIAPEADASAAKPSAEQPAAQVTPATKKLKPSASPPATRAPATTKHAPATSPKPAPKPGPSVPMSPEDML